ncbi:AMP-binding protein [Herbiconiux ginsengi]|uniref:3-phosphoshikimate 1-carboxyvinyltransferase/cyclohexanecarboxylate-CoA ligase n=1 Tax=Herbiconiux ginsengi TaxID=381665 RepID=A0A1H3S5Q0_9MICO|nr:AMP-binding protein [Herbiconiux ginsengi]SDZ33272.1 3-phosphoshikimate 1-carboxyvinyltransferase/cyclohexanecarboxylate-CoA ligase [Herbiconiux ginsengi]
MSGTGTAPFAFAPGVTAAVDVLAREQPDAPAVIEVGDRPRTLSWAELKAEADRVSAVLLDLGVQPGESVAFQLPNWAECVTVTLGVLQIGAVVAPIMPVFGEREVAMVLARAKARVLVLPRSFRKRHHAEELAAVVREAAASGRTLLVEHVLVIGDTDPSGAPRAGAAPADSSQSGVERGRSAHFGTSEPTLQAWEWHDFDAATAAAHAEPAAIAARRPSETDVAQLLFTSGTTGEPKGVQHAHRSLDLATAMEVAHLGLTTDDRIYIPSPLAHQTGFLYGLLLSWQLGVASVVQPIWDPKVALRQAFGGAHASFVQAATPFLMDVVEAVEGGETQPSSLRIFVATGAAVPRELAERATRVLDTAVCGAFGTTETCLGTLSAPSDPPGSAWGTDGRPLDGIRIRIVDDEGTELPAGREGNYELLSPTLFLGYLDRPDLTAEVFTPDGWYKTGDLGIVDTDGFLHVTGRVKDVINRGGEKIPVVEIENLLFTHPRVKDVAIVAMPDPRLGERACAFVVTADGQEPLGFTEMQEFLAAARVSKYYWPERLEAIEALPRNPVGKIQKNLLRERVAALLAAENDSTALESTEA